MPGLVPFVPRSYCVNYVLRVKYVYEQFTASDFFRLPAQPYDISANANSARRQDRTVSDSPRGADLCCVPRLRQGTGLQLGGDAADREFAFCPPNAGVSAR